MMMMNITLLMYYHYCDFIPFYQVKQGVIVCKKPTKIIHDVELSNRKFISFVFCQIGAYTDLDIHKASVSFYYFSV